MMQSLDGLLENAADHIDIHSRNRQWKGWYSSGLREISKNLRELITRLKAGDENVLREFLEVYVLEEIEVPNG